MVDHASYYGHLRVAMRSFVPRNARMLLDIGCGEGAFADGLRAEREALGQPLTIWGLELDEQAASRAAEKLDKIIVGPAETCVAELPDAFFDCVVLNDILEHLAWPEELLSALHRVLTPDARLVASMPNVRYFQNVWDLVIRGDWEYQDEGIRDRTHLRFFTRASMRSLFERGGYQLEQQIGINPTRSWRFRFCNLLCLGGLAEMRYAQYACVAVPAITAKKKPDEINPLSAAVEHGSVG